MTVKDNWPLNQLNQSDNVDGILKAVTDKPLPSFGTNISVSSAFDAKVQVSEDGILENYLEVKGITYEEFKKEYVAARGSLLTSFAITQAFREIQNLKNPPLYPSMNSMPEFESKEVDLQEFEGIFSSLREGVFGLQYGQNINPELLDQVTAKFFLMGPYRSKSLMRQIKRLEKEYNTPTIDSGLAPRLEAKEKCLYTKLAISQLNRYKAAKRRKARQQRK